MGADRREKYRAELRPLLAAALRSGNLRTWSGGVLTASGRVLDDRFKDDDILALEQYLLDHSGLPDHGLSDHLLAAFAAEVHRICYDETVSLRVSYNGVEWLMEAWRSLAQVRIPEDDPRVVLPACAVMGTGVHAVAFKAVAEGARILMHMASSPLATVREVVACGFQQMLAEDWPHTVHELRRYAHIGDAQQHRAAVLAVAEPLLLAERARALDALDLHHAILAAYRRLSPAARRGEHVQALRQALPGTIGVVLAAERRAGFAAAQTWLAWGDADITQIVRESVEQPPLAHYEEAAYLRQSFSNGRS